MATTLAMLPPDARLSIAVYGTTDRAMRHVRPETKLQMNETRAAAVAEWLRSEKGGAWTVDSVGVEMIEGKAADRRIEIVAVRP